MEATKNPVGRPTDYKPEYCELVVELGRKGYSLAQMAAEMGVSRKTLYEWQAIYPEFSDATCYGRDLAQAWFENIAQGNMVAPTPGFSATLWSKQVACRFPDDYTDKQKQEVSGSLSGLTVRFVKGTEDAG